MEVLNSFYSGDGRPCCGSESAFTTDLIERICVFAAAMSMIRMILCIGVRLSGIKRTEIESITTPILRCGRRLESLQNRHEEGFVQTLLLHPWFDMTQVF